MEQNKKHITTENVTEWLCSTGFLFPRNELELSRFEKLYGDLEETITGNEVDPVVIINGKTDTKIMNLQSPNPEGNFTEYKMVARNGSDIPKHIMDKIKKNQNNSTQNDNGLSKEKPE